VSNGGISGKQIENLLTGHKCKLFPPTNIEPCFVSDEKWREIGREILFSQSVDCIEQTINKK